MRKGDEEEGRGGEGGRWRIRGGCCRASSWGPSIPSSPAPPSPLPGLHGKITNTYIYTSISATFSLLRKAMSCLAICVDGTAATHVGACQRA